MKKTALFSMVCLILMSSGLADTRYVDSKNSTGTTPFGSYEGTMENIDLRNQNLNMVLPLFTLKGRNGLDYSVVTYYDSTYRTWKPIPDDYTPPTYELVGIPGEDAWFQMKPSATLSYVDEIYMDGGTELHTNRYILTNIDGTRHEFGVQPGAGDVYGGLCNNLETFRTTDSSHMKLVEIVDKMHVVIYQKDGTQLDFSTTTLGWNFKLNWIRDTNGNKITFQYNVPKVGYTCGYLVTDTLGREVCFRYSTGNEEVLVKEWDGTESLYRLKDRTQSTSQIHLPGGDTNSALRYALQYQTTSQLCDPDNYCTTAYGPEYKLDVITYPTGGTTNYDWELGKAIGESPQRISQKVVNAQDGEGTGTWQYQRNASTKVLRPDSSYSLHYFSVLPGFTTLETETKVEYYDSGGIKKRTIEKTWDQRFGDPRVTETKITLDNNYQSKTVQVYDQQGYASALGNLTNGNILETWEYGWGSGAPGALVRKTIRTFLNTTGYNVLNLHILDRITDESVYDSASVKKAQTTYTYDNYTSPRTLLSASGVVQHDTASFGTGYTTRGNLYRIGRWLNSPSSTLYTYFRYDICGNVREETDPRGYTSKANYNSTYQYAYPYWLEDAAGFDTYREYFFDNTNKRGFGYLKRDTDINNNQTDYTYDLSGRIKTISYPDGGLVTNYYSDREPSSFKSSSALPPKMKSQVRIDTGLDRVEVTGFDGLGRIQSRGISNGTQQDWVWTKFDTTGRPWQTSNPRTLLLGGSVDLPAVGDFNKWTTKEYDALDRVKKITTQDGQFVTIDYSGYQKTVTDQASMKRRVNYDALGRISSAVEPNLSTNSFTSPETTNYSYDVLDNLTGVSQGTQTRSFVYDSLSRLTSETNPESGTTTYIYDSNSNLTRKTDARSVQTNYNSYDVLDRPASISYSDGTPTVTFTYDSTLVTNGKGRRTGMTDTAAGTKTYHYDAMGRASKIVWQTAHFTQTGEFVYNKLGGLTQSKWPGIYDFGANPLGIYWSYDNAGRQQTAKWSNNGGGGGGTAYQELVDNSTFTYATTDPYATETITYDNATNGTIEAVTYNERLQPKQRTVKYGALFRLNQLVHFTRTGDGKNNGNVWEIDDQLYTAGDQSYLYDWWNRITTYKIAGTTNQTFTYDRWGNRNASTLALAFNSATNRITTTGYNSYDSAGNQLGLPGFTLQYDGASRIKTVNSGSTATYTYDGDGRRVKKVAGGVTTYYFYDPEGNALWEYKVGTGWETFNLFFNGKHAAINNTAEGLRWRHLDHLGSVVLKTNNVGSDVCRYYYKPYGELNSRTCAEADDYWFTGKERDAETGLDYFGARYYGSAMGRFTSVDPSRESADPANPQSWNRYAYTLNNPLIFVDPDGESPVIFLARLANHPMTQRALNVAQRYAAQAFNAATRFFNSPTGQDVMVSLGEGITGADLPAGVSGPLSVLPKHNMASIGKLDVGVGRSLGEIVREGLADTKTLSGETLSLKDYQIARIEVQVATNKNIRRTGRSVEVELVHRKTGEKTYQHILVDHKGRIFESAHPRRRPKQLDDKEP